MSEAVCITCNRRPVDKRLLCTECAPDTCYECVASDVYFDAEVGDIGGWCCSHGCELTVWECATRRKFTILINKSGPELLSYGGPRAEVIIPDGVDPIVHSDVPRSIDSNSMLVIHFSKYADEILEEGIKRPTEIEDEDPGVNTDSIRHNALYGWPFKLEHSRALCNWADTPWVALEVPADEVYISTYGFLDWTSPTPETKWDMALEKYEEYLTFSVDEFETACRTYDAPAPIEKTLLTR